jgi:methionyl aminopeptidase
MAVSIKSAREIELMREAGKRLAHVHQELEAMITPGISTWEIDAKGEKLIRDCGCIPNFLHYNGYPASICVSVNDEVVHGIPRKDRYLKEGDIVSLDAGLIYKGYHSDAARTHAVGKVSTEAQKLMDVTKQSFFEGIKMAKEGRTCMIFREPLRSMLHPMATELCGIWLAMESEQRFMKIRRFLTMHRKEEASAYRRA